MSTTPVAVTYGDLPDVRIGALTQRANALAPSARIHVDADDLQRILAELRRHREERKP